MARKIEQARWERYIQLRKLGFTRTAACRDAKISYSAAKAFEDGRQNSSGQKLAEVRDARDVPGVIPRDRLCPEALRALDDFAYFRRRFFGRVSTPWQEEAAHKVVEWLASPVKEYVDCNAPPGSGKSCLHTHDIPAWLTCRNRAIRGMIGSASQWLAERYTLALRTTLESPFPFRSEPEEIERGLAVDAEGVLSIDYGTFKPEATVLWSVKAFIVAQLDDRPLTHKEPTWSAYGPDSAQIGGRYDVIFWDDLVDEKAIGTLEAIEKQRRWWDRIAEKRLEPGGLLWLQGQRLSPEDLYRYTADKRAGDEEEADHDGCCDAEPGRRYHHIRFPAHWEDRCVGLHTLDAPYYPEGCLLDPRRLPWRELSAEMKASGSNYRQVFQQEDADPDLLLVNPLWVSGGTDPVTREEFPGCWDDDRDVGEVPPGVSGGFSVVTVDPSPTKFWAVQWWLWEPRTELRYLLDLEKTRMEASDFLDWNNGEQRFTGIMEDWQLRSVELGLPISHWIVERNAAQRFLLQYEHVKRWVALRGVDLIPHETQSNKSDPKLGVTSIAPHWRYGRVRLPGKGFGRDKARNLVSEVTTWPLGRTDDQVMAEWMGDWNRDRLWTPEPTEDDQLWRPSWLGGTSPRARWLAS